MSQTFLEDIPEFLEIQRNSFLRILQTGLIEALETINPILPPPNCEYGLLFYPTEYVLVRPTHSTEEAFLQGKTYGCKIYVPAIIINSGVPTFASLQGVNASFASQAAKAAKGQTVSSLKSSFLSQNKQQKPSKEWVCVGILPLMSRRGHFIINGSPRIVISQMSRAPGIYYETGEKLQAIVVPSKGAWFRMSVKVSKKGETKIWVRITPYRKMPYKIFMETYKHLENPESFAQSEFLDMAYKNVNSKIKDFDKQYGIGQIRRQINLTIRNPSSYTLGTLGRKRLNERLGTNTQKRYLTSQDLSYIKNTLLGLLDQKIYLNSSDDIDHLENRRVRTCGELLQSEIEVGMGRLKKAIVKQLDNYYNPDSSFFMSPKALTTSNPTVALKNESVDRSSLRGQEKQYLPLLDAENPKNRPVPLTNSLNCEAKGNEGKKKNLFISPSKIVSTKAFAGALREFFGSNPLSQYMDQTNPLAEITHKRRLSSLGPGGVDRASAGIAIRGIHPTHYGRICPIETPEGKNAGLVNSMTMWARLNKDGFLQTPYLKVKGGSIMTHTNNLSPTWHFVPTKQEGLKHKPLKIVASDLKISNSSFLPKIALPTRDGSERNFVRRNRDVIDFFGVSPVQNISVATSLIPFLEHDDATRALMGSNMQRQAVPLLKPQAPLIRTGLEGKVVGESGHALQAISSGVISSATRDSITIDSFTENKNDNSVCYASNSLSSSKPFSSLSLSFLLRNCKQKQEQTFAYFDCKQKQEVKEAKQVTRQKVHKAPLYTAIRDRLACTKSRTSSLFYKEQLCFNQSKSFLKSSIFFITGTPFAVFAELLAIACKHSIGYATFSMVENTSYTLRKTQQRQLLAKVLPAFVMEKQKKKASSFSFGYQSCEVTQQLIDLVAVLLHLRFLLLAFAAQEAKQKKQISNSKQAKAKQTKEPKGSCLFASFALLLAQQKQEAKTYSAKAIAKKAKASLCRKGVKVQRTRENQTLQQYNRSNQATICVQRPSVTEGQWVQKGDLLADCSASNRGVLSLGQNIVVAYLPMEGFNFEDAIVVSDRLVYEELYTSIHVERVEFDMEAIPKKKLPRKIKVKANRNTVTAAKTIQQDWITWNNPHLHFSEKEALDPLGIIKIGSWVGPDDVLVSKVFPVEKTLAPSRHLLFAVFKDKKIEHLETTDTSVRVPKGIHGRVINRQIIYTGKILSSPAKTFIKGSLKNKDSKKAIAVIKQVTAPLLLLSKEQKEQKSNNKKVAVSKNLQKSSLTTTSSFLEQGVSSVVLQTARQRLLGSLCYACEPKSCYEPKINQKQKKQNLKNTLFDKEFKIVQVRVYIAERKKLQVGDKMSGRHGNKGIVSTILPREDMPYLPDGTCVDMVLNPLGIPSRMNVGQVFECLLGLAAAVCGDIISHTPFDELYGPEASRSLVYLFLYASRLRARADWLFQPTFPGKTVLFDGRTGTPFEQWVTVGRAYMLKLIHMVDEKIHARSVGSRSIVTQQPVKGRARGGGQRVGEMEVWAFEGFGAAYTLQELLTIKSDDVFGRERVEDTIVSSTTLSAHVPETFKILLFELRCLCLNVELNAKDYPRKA